MFEFEHHDDESIDYNSFCSDYDENTNHIDEYIIVKDYIDNNEDFNYKVKSYLTIPLNLNTHIKMNTIAWHICSSILGIEYHSLNDFFVGDLIEKIFKENAKVNERFINENRGVACEIIGNNTTFFYKKSVENVLSNTYIGQNLHPSFSFLKDKGREFYEYLFGTFYRGLTKTSWLKNMKIKGDKTTGRHPSVFFYV